MKVYLNPGSVPAGLDVVGVAEMKVELEVDGRLARVYINEDGDRLIVTIAGGFGIQRPADAGLMIIDVYPPPR
jgi:hypothetical protein